MKDTNAQERVFLFPVLLLCGFAVLMFGTAAIPNISARLLAAAQVTVAVFFLTAAVTAYQSRRLKNYWLVLFACFTAAFSLLIATRLGVHGPSALLLGAGTPAGIAIEKLSEALIVLFFVLAFSVAARSDLASIYLERGDLGKGLTIGLVALGSFFVIGVVIALSRHTEVIQLAKWAPWILVYALSRGFVEELLYRGLFLRRLEPLIGANASNVLTAMVFTMAHTKAYLTHAVPNVAAAAGLTLALGLFSGWLMQKTESIIGPALFHAGADIMIVIGIFSR
jgi:membrane protease YdiL (CAAX protease family)